MPRPSTPFLWTLWVSFFLIAANVLHAQYALRTLENRWPDIDIIALVDVGPVTEVSTPQDMILQSANARIVRLIYRRSPPWAGEPVDKIVIYSFLPNGMSVICPAPVKIGPGRAFVMMKEHGINKFSPSDPWEYQPLRGNVPLVAWKDPRRGEASRRGNYRNQRIHGQTLAQKLRIR